MCAFYVMKRWALGINDLGRTGSVALLLLLGVEKG